MSTSIPTSVRAVLWSYNIDALDLEKNKKSIVSQILNYGNEKAIKWLFKQYPMRVVAQAAQSIPLNQWNKKSLAMWRLILDLKPQERFKSYASP